MTRTGNADHEREQSLRTALALGPIWLRIPEFGFDILVLFFVNKDM